MGSSPILGTMANISNNPHKPGTDEWKEWEKEHIRDGYAASAPVERARLVSVAEQYAKTYDKNAKYLDVLDFIENKTEPEYDPVLDKPKKDSNYWLSLTDTVSDPLGWDKIKNFLLNYGGSQQIFNYIPSYPRVPSVVVPRQIPDEATGKEVLLAMDYVHRTEYSKHEWDRGWVEVIIPRHIDYLLKYNNNPIIASAMEPHRLYLQFYIK